MSVTVTLCFKKEKTLSLQLLAVKNEEGMNQKFEEPLDA
jgi:hypothetical protein